MSRPTRTGTRRRALSALAGTAGLVTLATLVAGCGVRATSVPVDAGAAPSRVGCVLPEDRSTADERETESTARVYLVCSSRVSSVDRRVEVPESHSAAGRAAVARKLLTALQAAPDSGEESAGFGTDVPRDLKVEAPRSDDPEGALRLSAPPPELPSFALAQIVCTFADSTLADSGRTVTLGGPDAARERVSELRQYECDSTLRTRAETARTAGTPV